MTEQATVVYADILGFSALVLSMPSSIDRLDGSYHSAMSRAQLRKSIKEERLDQLERTFVVFHRTLDLRVSELVNVDPLQSIVFSDCAYVVFRDPNMATYFAQAFMRDLISFRVPARMGIGRGTFRGLRFATDTSEVTRHSSQFLGTGVIRAHQAESCGLEGLRIFIHTDSEMKEDWPGDLCIVADETTQKTAPPVTLELNYLEHYPDFTPTPEGAQTTDEAYGEIVTAVTEMMGASPEGERAHYRRTLDALARMRDAYKQHIPPPSQAQ